MSPIKVERENPDSSFDVFTVPNGKKYTIDLAGNGRVNLFGTLLGGYIENIPNTHEPHNKLPLIRLSIYDESTSLMLKQRYHKEETKFIFTGVLI
jgi:hypothetical protein